MEEQKPQATEAPAPKPVVPLAKPVEQAVRPLDYVLVRHLGRSAASRHIRADRAGYRRQRFMLSDGQRIRRQNARTTEFGYSVFIKDFSRFIEGVTVGMIEVVDPVSLRPIPLADLPEYAGKIAQTLKMDLVIDKERLALVKEYGYLHEMIDELSKPTAEESTPKVLAPVVPVETPTEAVGEPKSAPVEEVKDEEPKVEDVVAEEAKAEAPAVEEPKVEEPKVEEVKPVEAPAKHKGRRSR